MLILSRKKNESIVISEDVVITVMEIGDGKVRLGITAPKYVPIDRLECRLAKLAVRLLRCRSVGETSRRDDVLNQPVVRDVGALQVPEGV